MRGKQSNEEMELWKNEKLEDWVMEMWKNGKKIKRKRDINASTLEICATLHVVSK